MLRAPRQLPAAHKAAWESMPEARMAGRRLALARRLLDRHAPRQLPALLIRSRPPPLLRHAPRSCRPSVLSVSAEPSAGLAMHPPVVRSSISHFIPLSMLACGGLGRHSYASAACELLFPHGGATGEAGGDAGPGAESGEPVTDRYAAEVSPRPTLMQSRTAHLLRPCW